MESLVPFVVGMGAADLALLWVFALLHRETEQPAERREHLRRWAAAHGFDAIRQILTAAGLALGGSILCSTVATLAHAIGAWFLLDGALRFASRRSHVGWAIGAALAGIWGAIGHAVELPFALATVATSGFLGLARVAAGIVLLRAEGAPVARALPSSALILWGLHTWNFPFFRELDWFAPWGFQIATTLATCVGIGMLLVHLERARAEERASAARFQDLFDGAIEGFFRTSPEGKFVAANPALVRMLGYERESELLALDLVRDVYADPADRARVLAHPDGDIANISVKRRDGRIIEVAVHARRVRDGEGRVRFYEGSMRDVTEEARLREELAQAQRMEALGRMAGGIAHDFNNALGAITAAADLARVRLARGERLDRELEDVRDSALRAADLTRQLLALARRQPLRRQLLDVRDVASAAARVVGRVIGERIEVDVELGEVPLTVLADSGQLEHVLMNLALNSRDAMPEGGTLRIVASRVDVEGAAYARLRVEDTGVGMDEETRRHMFDPFFTTKTNGGGSGLGLAMVYGAVTQSGGRIEVESARGSGTRVDVLLPIAAGEPMAVAVRSSPPGGAARRRARILLVEDEAALRRSVEAALRDAGHDVRAAGHAGEAFDHLLDWPLDLLVTDVVMPGLSGPDLAREVRKRHPLCPVVFLTGYAPEPLAIAAEIDGVSGEAPRLSERSQLLAKPFTVDALLDAVARALESRDAEAAATALAADAR